MTALADLYRSYLDLRWHFDPAAATSAGVTAQDARLGDFSADRMREHLAGFKALATAVENLEIDDTQEEIDRTAFLDELRVTVFRFEKERPHLHDPSFWLAHLYGSLQSLLRRRGDGGPERARALLARVKAAPGFLAAARGTIVDPPQVFLDTASAMADGGVTLFGAVSDAIRRLDPALVAAADEAQAEAEAALARFGVALRGELRAHPDNLSFAIGEEQFNRRLHHEHALQASAPELYRYGLHLTEEIAAEVVRIAREIDPAVPWRTVVERLRASAPSGPDLLGAFSDAAERVTSFLAARDLFTMPAGELEILETPAFLRPLIPFAAYFQPPALADEPVGRLYVTTPTHGGSGGSRHEIPVIAVHEVWPGHHLQKLAARSAPTEIRRLTSSPLAVEGWALYAEELMAEQGLFASAEERLFQRLHLLWRALRITLDVGLHTRGMTPGQAADLLVDTVAMDRTHANAEVSRYCAWPSYQLCYAVGRRELLHLRQAWRDAAGPSAPLREFHDQVLAYGGLPVSLTRWGMGLGLDE